MGSREGAKAPESALAQLCAQAKIGEKAADLLTAQSTTKDFIALLVQKEFYPDAIRIVAHLLPKRESIGWGCLCVRHLHSLKPDKPLPEVHSAVERWVSAPNEDNRWAAKKMADGENPKSLSGLLAMAVFFAGPSMAPANLQAVPPPETATPETVGNVVVLAGVVTEPEKAKEKHRVFMQKASALIARLQNPGH
jgi:hypothetical protein